ncbi:hypothetical protein [Nostoc sp. GT001]|uniref:hypothetical protein n=1 Tax=Nostoc sp. GT001 TaxID=3056647 RepID=UPI0025AABFC3|nr:hypothetical protein [Nostoc sp. GT001]MDM9581915.1 hypothetical protein [Nostoc sp. GT001]
MKRCTEFRLRGNRATCAERSRGKSRFNYRRLLCRNSPTQVFSLSEITYDTETNSTLWRQYVRVCTGMKLILVE